MKRIILPILTSCLIASSVHAVPLTWNFIGTTEGGLAFELRIFLDTNLVGQQFPGLSDVFFQGPFQGAAEIDPIGVVTQVLDDVRYFLGSPGSVTGVGYSQAGAFNGIQFPSSISSDTLHLTPIAPTAPNSFNTIDFFGPNGLIRGEVATFSATLATTVPEGGSTALLLSSAIITLGFLRRRMYG